MGRRSYWNAVRMVADNIEAGDRSFWNLTKIPDLPTSGLDAIHELEEKGLVKASWLDDHVEPTPEFWRWLEEQQSIETAQAIARQKAMPLPWQVPAPAPEPAKPLTVAVPAVPDAPNTHSYTRRWCFSTKYGRPRITNREFMCVHEMCLRILDFMGDHGGHVTSSALRRGLNAYRYPEQYEEAFQTLLSLKGLKLEKEPGSRRQWVTCDLSRRCSQVGNGPFVRDRRS